MCFFVEDAIPLETNDDRRKDCNNSAATQNTKSLNIMHFNIQGLQSKSDSLEMILDGHHIDIVCFSEHWQSEIEINLMNIKSYSLVNYFCRKDTQHGGVSIYARDDILIKPLIYTKSIEKHFEVAISVIDQTPTKMFVVSVYRTPDSDLDVFIESFELLMDKIYNSSSHYIVAGDFNVNLLLNNARSTELLLNCFLQYNIKPHISEATRKSSTSHTCIDNIYSNIPITQKSQVFDSFLSDHTFQICRFGVGITRESQTSKTTIRNFCKSNISAFKTLISKENWHDVFFGQDINNMFDSFYSTIKNHFYHSFPIKKTQFKKQDKKWYTPYLRGLHDQLCELSRIKKQVENTVISERFYVLKKFYRKSVMAAKRTYNDERIMKSTNTMRESWQIVREMTYSNKSRYPTEMSDPISQTRTSDPGKICNILNTHFTKNLSNTDSINMDKVVFPKNNQHTIFLYGTTPKEVMTTIYRTTRKPAPGLDEIGGGILREISEFVAKPLSVLINKSFCSGVYPEALKASKAVPVFKNKGERTDAGSYRLICLGSQISKVFELCYNNRLTSFAEEHSILSVAQHAFREKKSTITAVSQATSFIYEALNNKKHTIGLFFDLSRAFDTLRHDILLLRLESIGVRGVALNWINSYLTNRSQLVVMGGAKSTSRTINLGIPQGSILGPLLFLIYFDGVVAACPTADCTILYADDTTILIEDVDIQQLTKRASQASMELNSWCSANGLSLNVSKTLFSRFIPKNNIHDTSLYINARGQSIHQASSVRFLGVTLDEKLTWMKHINMVCQRLSAACFVMRTIKGTLSDQSIKAVYYGIAQSHITYGLILWGSTGYATNVLIWQKKLLRIMFNIKNPNESCRPVFTSNKILTVICLFIYQVSIFIKQHLSKYVRNNQLHQHNTRSSYLLHQPFSRLETSQHCHIYQGIKIYNYLLRILPTLRDCPLRVFKRLLSEFLRRKPYYSLTEFFNNSI